MRRKWLEEVAESRQAMIDRKKSEDLRKKQEEQLAAAFWKQWCMKLDKDEADERNQRKALAKKISEDQLAQVQSHSYFFKNIHRLRTVRLRG